MDSRLTTLYQVYLAMEQRESDVETKAMSFTNEFTRRFRSISFTIHPPNIPGELPGKGSNLAWAARQLSQRYTPAQRKDVIVTGIDGKCRGVVLEGSFPPLNPTPSALGFLQACLRIVIR